MHLTAMYCMYLLSIVYAFHAYLLALLGVFLDAEACAGCMRFCQLAVSRIRSLSIYLLYSYSSVHAIPVSRDCRLDRVNLIAIRTLRRIVVKSTTRSFAANQPISPLLVICPLASSSDHLSSHRLKLVLQLMTTMSAT